MYAVKRPFKSLGEFYAVGSIVSEPTAIKHFKSRLGAGDIIVVTEQNYDTCKAYFKGKYKVDIPGLAEPDAESGAEPNAEPDAEPDVKLVTKSVVKPLASKVVASIVK